MISFSCSNVSREDLKHLNGNWEISYVRFPDGSKKEFNVNETIDAFKLTGSSGTRQKMKPQFDGSYVENGSVEKFDIVESDGNTYLKYKAEFHSWTEEIINLNHDEFAVRNDDKKEFYYKRAVPFNIK